MQKETKNTWFVLFGLLLVRLLPALVIAAANDGNSLPGHFDQSVYVWGAETLLRTGVNPFSFFPPLQFLFIAAFLHLAGGKLIFALIASVLVGWLTVVGIYLLAELLFDRTTALVAAVLFGIYPGFILYGIVLTSETLAIFFIVFAFLLIARYLYRGGWLYLAGAGFLWGLASQTRGGLHYFVAGIVAVLLLQRCGRSRRLAISGAFVFAVIALGSFAAIGTWVAPVHGGSALNSKSGMGSVVHGANRITTSCADYGNIRGNIFYDINNTGERWPEGSELFFKMDIMEKNTAEILLAVFAFIMEDPVIYVTNSFKKWSCLWTPNQFAIHEIKNKLYYKSAILTEIACLVISMFYFLSVCGGIWGVGASRDRFRPLFAVLVLFYLALIFFTVGNSKLRLPMMPFFIMYSAYFIVSLIKKSPQARQALRNKWFGALVAVLLLNGVIKYQEILLTPAEIKVQKIELCVRLGFPKTALSLYEANSNFRYFDDEQKKRLHHARARAFEFSGEKAY